MNRLSKITEHDEKLRHIKNKTILINALTACFKTLDLCFFKRNAQILACYAGTFTYNAHSIFILLQISNTSFAFVTLFFKLIENLF